MRTLWYRRIGWVGVSACLLLPSVLSTAEEFACGKPTPGPVCEDPEFPPCNQTDILAQIDVYENAGSAGVNSSYWCPKLKYPNCPNGLRQSNVVDTNPAPFFERLDGAGSVYLLDGELGPKVCYNSIPCQQTAHVSTMENNQDCYPCLIGPTEGFDPELGYPDPEGRERCGNYAWCIPVEDPPSHVISVENSVKWDKLVFNDDCDELWGAPGE